MGQYDDMIESIFKQDTDAHLRARSAYAVNIIKELPKSYIFAQMLFDENKELAIAIANDIQMLELIGEQNAEHRRV